MSRARSRTANTMLVLVATVLMISTTAAHAGPPDESGVVERAPQLSAWVFWDGDGLIVLTGPALEEGCVGEGFQFPVATTVDPPGGTTMSSFNHTDSVWVYAVEGISDPLVWLFGQACPAVVAGGGPQPLASGEGRVTRANDNVRMSAQVTTTADGLQGHVNAVGDVDGFPDFINYTG